MEIIDKFSKSLGLAEQEEGTDEAQTINETQTVKEEPPEQKRRKNSVGRNVINFNTAVRDNLMTNSNNNNINFKNTNKSKIATVCPKSFDDDAKVIADFLRDDIPVIINLDNVNPEEARRIIDFALGTTYAIEGDVQQVNPKVFVCTPQTSMVTFHRDEEKQNDRDFSWLTRKI
ncbi:MAG: cell division protein SepF [Selenomonadaceae bacterium]|nr:cell division protein SepF [Selenomonadaceae bacterium]